MSDPELLAVFERELDEALDRLARLIEELHATSDLAGEREQLQDAYRIAHNIKGAARAVDAANIESLTHELEDLFAHYLGGELRVNQIFLDQVLAAIVTMEQRVNGDADPDAVEALLSMLVALRGLEGPRPVRPARPRSAGAEPERGSEEAAGPRATSLRVDPERLDRVIAHTGEFLAAAARGRAQVEDSEALIDDLRGAIASLPVGARSRVSGVLRQLEVRAQRERREQQRLSRLIDSFGEAMKRVRMFPLAELDKQWRAVLRSAAEATGKRARLQLELGAIELDKRVLDELRDPFVHLLRNAVDHGIEDRATRRDAGKDEVGVITISASLVGAKVRVEIRDDGRGLDPEAIGARAVARGIIDAATLAQMSVLDVYELVFRAGFSTAEGVSRLSGRGLGLDVVRERVEALSGTVEIGPATEGTCVRLVVPTTLVSTRGLLVRAGTNVYALPLDCVLRTLRVDADSLEQVDGGVVLRSADSEPLRVRWLAALYGHPRSLDPAKLIVVVVSDGRVVLGLVVAEVIGEAEFMAKALPWNLGELPGVSGVMTRPDGGLAVVADVPHLLERGKEAASAEHRALASSAARPQRILVVDDSLTSRTLERNILAAAGYEVALTCDGEEAWRHLQRQTVDLVVTDIEMPQLDGIELTRRIRASAKLGEIPIILVSSLDGPEDRAAGAAAGADEYVVKGSFDRRVLLEAVTRLI